MSRVCGDLSLSVSDKAIKTTAFYFSLSGENQHRLWLYTKRIMIGQKPKPTLFLKGMIFMKSKRFNFRVTDTMDALIRKKAADAGMSITDYIILCAIDKKVINYDGLRELTTQVKKLGNNVNQLLILSRQGRINTVNLTATQEELKKIYELLAEQLPRR